VCVNSKNLTERKDCLVFVAFLLHLPLQKYITKFFCVFPFL
jgi:hypothetical protein